MNQTTKPRRKLTETDRKILKALLELDGSLNTSELSGRIGVPRSTVERRRKYLETNILTRYYHLDVTKLGYRRIDFLIATGSGYTRRILTLLMKFPQVIAVSQTIGEHTIDLIAELILKDNSEILLMSEKIKGMHGVRDVVWTEVIDESRKKKTVPDYIIDEL